MAYVPHNRLTILGTILGTPEDDVFAMNINFGGDLSPQPYDGSLDTQIATILTTWWNSSQGGRVSNHPQVLLDGFKFNHIGVNGRYTTPQSTNEYWFPSSIVGTGSGARLPASSALALSFYTPLKGRRYRGRIYIPFTQGTLDANWRVNPTTVAGLADATSKLLRDMNSLLGPWNTGFGHAVVASSYNVNTPITKVRVGDSMDSQRRRDNKFADSWYESDV